jgi:hypothetical protein
VREGGKSGDEGGREERGVGRVGDERGREWWRGK